MAWQGTPTPSALHPATCPSQPPVIRMMMLCARQTEYLLKIFRLRYVSTLLSSIGPVVQSLLDILVEMCVVNKYILPTSYFHQQHFSLLAFERSAPKPSVLPPTASLHQKFRRRPRSPMTRRTCVHHDSVAQIIAMLRRRRESRDEAAASFWSL